MLKLTSKTKINGPCWIGDPCYVFPDSRWSEFCDTIFSKREIAGFLEDDGETFFYSGTAYGDGEYPVNRGGILLGRCGVDAGLLALIPVSLIKKWGSLEKAADLGLFVGVSGVPEETTYGSWKCGDIVVNTEGEDEDFLDED